VQCGTADALSRLPGCSCVLWALVQACSCAGKVVLSSKGLQNAHCVMQCALLEGNTLCHCTTDV
jgi:hypothetical protein